jgi:DNA modification methylase
MEKCVRLATSEAETILDPFLGSGTTAVAAKKLGSGTV